MRVKYHVNIICNLKAGFLLFQFRSLVCHISKIALHLSDLQLFKEESFGQRKDSMIL
jgi:hypothetical protein